MQNGASTLEEETVTNFEPTNEDTRTPEHSTQPGTFPGTGLDFIKHAVRHLLALMEQLPFRGARVLAVAHAAFHQHTLASEKAQKLRKSLKL